MSSSIEFLLFSQCARRMILPMQVHQQWFFFENNIFNVSCYLYVASFISTDWTLSHSSPCHESSVQYLETDTQEIFDDWLNELELYIKYEWERRKSQVGIF